MPLLDEDKYGAQLFGAIALVAPSPFEGHANPTYRAS